MQGITKTQPLSEQWDNAVERAQQETQRQEALGEMLTHSAGLHINSGVRAGGLWGTTSCTCADSCDCPRTLQVC